MKIALVSPYDYARHGGVNQHIEHLKREYTARGHTVVVIAPLSEPVPEPDVLGFHAFGGVFPVSANGSVARVSLSLNRWRIKRLMQQAEFDVMHLHEPLVSPMTLLALNYSTSVNVGTFHAYAESNLAYFYARPVLQRFFRRLDAVVAVSRPARDFASQYFEADWQIIPNGVDTEAFRRAAAPIPELMDGRPNMLFLGRFDESRKGYKYALRALRWVKQMFPDVRLVVVGRGNPGRYAGVVRKYSLENNVHYAGVVSDEDRARYMASCRFLVAPSTHGESQGIVLLEAMAAGLPVIAGRIPGYATVLRHDVEGFLTAPASEHSLAVAMVRLLSDPALVERMGVAGRAKAEEYSWAKIAERLLALYSEVQERRDWLLRRAERRNRLRVALRKSARDQ